MNSILQRMTVIALCCAIMGCSADTEQSGVKYQEKDVDYSAASVGAFPQARLSETLGTFVLPKGFLKHLREEDIVPQKGTLFWQLCERINHHPQVRVSKVLDDAVRNVMNLAQQNQQEALRLMWFAYASNRETLLSKLSSTGTMGAKEVDEVLDLNVADVCLRVIDPEYEIHISQVIGQVNASIKQNQGADLSTRLTQLQEQFKGTLMQIGASRIMQNMQQNQAVMDWAIGGLNQIRERNKQSGDNFWAWRERKLETQTPTKYAGSGLCAYCGGLVTVGGKCPVSQDGRHHLSGAGPKMIDPSHEGVRAR